MLTGIHFQKHTKNYISWRWESVGCCYKCWGNSLLHSNTLQIWFLFFFFLYRQFRFITYQLPLISPHFWKWPLCRLCCMSEMSERSEEWQWTPQQQAALKAASLWSQDKAQQPWLPSTSHVERSPLAIVSCSLRREWQTLDKWARKLHSSLLLLPRLLLPMPWNQQSQTPPHYWASLIWTVSHQRGDERAFARNELSLSSSLSAHKWLTW